MAENKEVQDTTTKEKVYVPDYVAFFSVMGATSAMVFSAFGAAYGTAKSGAGISAMGVMKPDMIMKAVLPVIMAGIVAIYGVVLAVLITGATKQNIDGAGSTSEAIRMGFMHFGAGLAVGLSGLASGFAIGIVGDSGVRGMAQQAKIYVGMILILIFAEVLGLYGMITALVMMYSK